MSTLARQLFVALLVAGLLAPRPALADEGRARYESVRDAYLSLRDDHERQRFRHNYTRIIERFEEFVRDLPDHERAPAALYNAGNLAWDLYKVSRVAADLRKARVLYIRLSEEYPSSSLADDGLFLNGRILVEHGGDIEEAYEVFQAVVERFPDGDMVPEAREMIERLAPQVTARRRDPERGEVATVIARSGGWRGRSSDATADVGAPSVDVGDALGRIALPVSEPVRYRQGEVPADETRGLPRRTYVDMQPARLDGASVELAVESGLLARVRLAQFSLDTVRLVLDLREDRPVALFPLLAEGALIVDVTPDDHGVDPVALVAGVAARRASEPLKSPREVRTTTGSEHVQRVREILRQPQEVPLSVQAGLKVRRIVIDPGHGGRDVGAVGPGGLREKDVVLAISKKVGERLAEHGLEVVYTRTDDVFVRLEDRTALANDKGADLFVSIHANAASRRDRRGVSTYYLDVTSDRYAMRLAARENATSERSVGELQLILADLTTRHNTDESARLAQRIQENLVSTLSREYDEIRCLGVQYALFFVLLGARMPSVLVETSFMSNPDEERRLADESYREQVAEGIFRGVLSFIEERERLAMGR